MEKICIVLTSGDSLCTDSAVHWDGQKCWCWGRLSGTCPLWTIQYIRIPLPQRWIFEKSGARPMGRPRRPSRERGDQVSTSSHVGNIPFLLNKHADLSKSDETTNGDNNKQTDKHNEIRRGAYKKFKYRTLKKKNNHQSCQEEEKEEKD